MMRSLTNTHNDQVTEVSSVGMGDRVCVDTCSLLGEDEGMLVGSAGQGLFLVLSEAAQSDYVASRPFRVNAGPVHSYCLCPDGKTRCREPARPRTSPRTSGGLTRRA